LTFFDKSNRIGASRRFLVIFDEQFWGWNSFGLNVIIDKPKFFGARLAPPVQISMSGAACSSDGDRRGENNAEAGNPKQIAKHHYQPPSSLPVCLRNSGLDF